MLLAAYVGAKEHASERWIGLFAMTAGLQIAFGLLILILALFEKPRGIGSLIFGSVVYVCSIGVSLMAFSWGLRIEP
jgi:hypothetical protein